MSTFSQILTVLLLLFLLQFSSTIRIRGDSRNLDDYGYENSCRDSYIIMSNGYLMSSCKKHNGKHIDASINLNTYLEITSNGRMNTHSPYEAYGNFATQCENVTVDDHANLHLTNCKASNGSLVSSTYYIGSKIYNDDGVLKWENIR